MAKIVLPTIASTTDVSLINENFRKIAEDLNNKVLYRKNPVGESNTLDTNMDANGKQIYNLPAPTLEHQAARYGDIKGAIDASADANEAALTALAASELSTVASGVAVDAAADALVASNSAEEVLVNSVKKTEIAQPLSFSVGGFSGPEAQKILDYALPLQDYSGLRLYSGRAKLVRIVGVLALSAPDPISGSFQLVSSDTTSVDNGGTLIVDALGRRWARVFTGPVYVGWFGAKGDGVSDDFLPCTAAITASGSHGQVVFNKTASNVYALSQGLKYYSGQFWSGLGGVNVLGGGTKLRLISNSSSVAEPANPSATTFCFRAEGIYFDAQGFADCALSLYNTSYGKIDLCSFRVTKDNAAGILFDSNVDLQCYFNTVNQARVFASGIGSAGMRFARGANANQVKGGKCGSSWRGMEFLSLSSGNEVSATDFEENIDCHIYVDSPNQVFNSLHMESAPIGYVLTANATNTQRMNTTFATTCVINVQDSSKIGTVLDTRSETSSIKGDLRFGPARFVSTYLSGGSTLDYNPDLVLGTSNALVRLFLNTTTTGLKRFTVYKGDGSSTITSEIDAATGSFYAGDITQENPGTGIARRVMRRAAVPTTGTFAVGDKIIRTNPSLTAVVTEWTCVASGTPGTWQATSWITLKGATSARPVLTANDTGVMYLDTTLAAAGKPIWWSTTVWVDALGATV